jgi:hypothetical protein
VVLEDGFVPATGNTFKILKYGSRSGAFSRVLGRNLGNRDSFNLLYDPLDVTLRVS